MTDITLFFSNTGGAISKLRIEDLICNKDRYDDQFAANDAKEINGFCVRDASSSSQT
jgi:hypothetical protein